MTFTDALGMSARQLAQRMGIAQQAIARLEKDEIHGSVTIKTLRRVAEQLDCVFVYGFVPKSSLEETVSRQAALVLKHRMHTAGHSMALENQSLEDDQYRQAIDELVSEMVSSSPRGLWDYK